MVYLQLDRTVKTPLAVQLFQAIRAAILAGTIQPGEKLPSTRELSKTLNVARNVVIECYEQLTAEGYAQPRKGSGTYICQGVQIRQAAVETAEKPRTAAPKPPVYAAVFRTGVPELDAIPLRQWARLYQRVAADTPPEQLDYQSPYGDARLREQLAQYLSRARGVATTAENIIITNGAAQSFSLLCQLVDRNEYALVEDPVSDGFLHTLTASHVKILPMPVDEQGMVTETWPIKPPKLIFTTPSHQFPTGVVLPAGRRIEMIRYARQNGALIVEDDYDSEFRFDGSPIQSMQSLAPESVIYVGTFSKTLMPALRIGYMVLPPQLCERMRKAKYTADVHSPVLEQRTLAEFLASGSFERHIRRMRKRYLQKRNALTGSLRRAFGEHVSISGAEAGLHLVVTFDGVTFTPEVMARMAEKGVQINALRQYCLTPEAAARYAHSLLFGYGNVTVEAMEKGVRLLASALPEAQG